MWLLSLMLACSDPDPTFPVTGTVVGVKDASVVVAHDDIEGFMDAMTMPFAVHDPTLLEGLAPGAEISGTLVVSKSEGTHLSAIAITKAAKDDPVRVPAYSKRGTLPVGEVLPSTPVVAAVGDPITLGAGQSGRIAVTFVYTRCPVPEYCPLVVSRFQALQEKLPKGARLVAVTLDPAYDSRGVLREFAEESSAVPGKWDFARLPKEQLVALAERAGLEVSRDELDINHGLVMLILDGDGRLVKRYDHMKWEMSEVLGLLSSG